MIGRLVVTRPTEARHKEVQETKMTITTVRATRLVIAVFVLSAGWLAAPHARQEYGANDGILLFVTDRDNPSPGRVCGELRRDLRDAARRINPVRLTSGGADVVVDGPAYNNGGPDWSHEQKLIGFQSNRVGGTPQVYLMRPDGTDQRVLLSLEIQRALRSRRSRDGVSVVLADG